MAIRGLVRAAGVVAVALSSFAATGIADAATPPPSDVNPSIVGGVDVDIKEAPFTVALVTPDGQQFCGGTLAAPNKVITAAHCTEGQQAGDIQAVSGRTLMSGQDGTVSKVTNIWIHPQYQGADSSGYDSSVLTLENPVQDKPIGALATAEDEAYKPGTTSTVLGWGTTSSGGEQSDHLKKVDVPIVAPEECKKAYPNVNETMACAGVPEGGKDSCQGDSGGPLVVGDKLVGIVSWGEGCAQPGKPGVYGKVGFMNKEITEQIQAG
jgi:secreted trypsin-like serine protease